MTNSQRREPVTSKTLHVGFNALMKSAESHYVTLDGVSAQSVLRPVYDAIREAQRLVDIAYEKAALVEHERRLAGVQDAIEERRRKIARLEKSQA